MYGVNGWVEVGFSFGYFDDFSYGVVGIGEESGFGVGLDESFFNGLF